ncbi:MAG: ABC transporter permease [Bacteroidales bacterium]|nr:ABC transporter permease [Bacteroidales bacterium]
MKISELKTAFFVAWRYLFSKKKHNIVHIISIISVVGIAVSTAALIIVLSVFNGMQEFIESNFNSFNPDIEIKPLVGKTLETDSFPFEQIRRMKNVRYVDEIVSDMALVTYGDCQALVTVKGVSDAYINHFNMSKLLIDGVLPERFSGDEWVLAGAVNAGTLRINLNRYELLKIHYPKRTKKNFANPMEAFNTSYLQPIGVFETNTAYDEKYVFAPLNYVRELMAYDGFVTSVEVRLNDEKHRAETQAQIAKLLDGKCSVKNKYEQEELLFKTMKSEKLVVYLILSFILVLAAFNAIGTLGMMIVEKKEDIRIIRQLGASLPLTRSVFLLEGTFVSLLGGLSGMVLGALVCFLQQTFHFVTYGDGVSYALQYYPVSMHGLDFLVVFCIVMVISFLSSYFPTRVIKK